MLIIAGLAGLLVLFAAGTLLFQAGCALADVPERGYVRSLPVYSAAFVVCLPLASVLIWFAGRFDTDSTSAFGAVRIAAAMAALLLSWLVSAGIFTLLLSTSIKKGLVIAAVELLLMVLSAALVSALVLVVLALVQIASRTPPTRTSLAPLCLARSTNWGARS